jgi:hypothetical protein
MANPTGSLKKMAGDLVDMKMLKGIVKTVGPMNIAMGIGSYASAKNEGKSTIGSIGDAVAQTALFDVAPVLMMTAPIIEGLPKVAVGVGEKVAQMQRSMSMMSINKPFQNATFADNQQAYTMRQAGMKLAQASKYNLQQTLMGNEASYMHI